MAGPNAQNTVISWTGNVQVWVYVTEQVTVDPGNPRWVSSPHPVALTPGQTYYIVVGHGPLGAPTDFSMAVTESPAYAGTWVNPAYNGGDGGPTDAPAKIVMTANLFEFYANDIDTTPTGTMSFDLARDWPDVPRYFARLLASVAMEAPGKPGAFLRQGRGKTACR